jgi:hypothetical protein
MTEPDLDNEVTSTLYRVSVSLTPSWPDKPALWFAQVELDGVTS